MQVSLTRGRSGGSSGVDLVRLLVLRSQSLVP